MAKHTAKKSSKAAKVAKGAVATGTAIVVTGKAVKTAWNYCLPWPLGCGHSEPRQGCKCCKKHV